MQAKIKYEFSGKLWKDFPGGWVFISLPMKMSKEIRNNLQWQEEGWGRMKASAKINKIEWDTAIWFDTKQKIYLLPIKSDIRKKVSLQIGDMVSISILL